MHLYSFTLISIKKYSFIREGAETTKERRENTEADAAIWWGLQLKRKAISEKTETFECHIGLRSFFNVIFYWYMVGLRSFFNGVGYRAGVFFACYVLTFALVKVRSLSEMWREVFYFHVHDTIDGWSSKSNAGCALHSFHKIMYLSDCMWVVWRVFFETIFILSLWLF